jgi:plastocyanin
VRRALALAAVFALALVPAAAAAHHHRKAQTRAQRTDERVRQAPHVRRVPKPPVTAPLPVPDPTPKPRPLARMQAVTREFSITLSRRTLPAGQVSIELANMGEDPHDLRVERADAPASGFSFTLAKPGTRSSRKLELAPGEWKLYCTLEGHAAMGMSTTVTVTG